MEALRGCKSPNHHLPKLTLKMKQRVLFLCTGNYYRSRFAEIYFNWLARQQDIGWSADSRGLALDGCNYGPISRHTLNCLTERGINSDSYDRFPLPATE